MPIYEFRCPRCQEDLEIFSTVEKHGTEVCPLCGQGELVRAFRTAPYVSTVGCPSGDIKRLANMKELEKKTNRKFDERNRDEIAAAKWEILDDKTVERGEEATRKLGLAPGAGFKPLPSAAQVP